jgi:hypothetical protein
MSPLDQLSKENKALSLTHLQPTTEPIVTQTTKAVQNILWNVSLPLLSSLNELNLLDNLEYLVTEESDNEEPVETGSPVPSNDAKQQPFVRIIPQAWQDYSEKWFYSYPFGDEST